MEIATILAHRVRESRDAAGIPEPVPMSGNAPTGAISLAQGDAGLALAYGVFDACYPDQGWSAIAHHHLQAAANDAQQGAFAAGLFGGLAGLGFVAWSLSHGGARYARLLASVDEALLPHVIDQAQLVAKQPPGTSESVFDLISGFSGIGAYLLCRSSDPRIAYALDRVLDTLVVLVRPTENPPAWWTPAGLIRNPDQAAAYPHGNLNCGMAHGIPGVLALMALALSHGRKVSGLGEAVEHVAWWLIAHRVDDRWGPNWPTAVPLTETGIAYLDTCNPARSGWCYGAPGVARSLWLAGVALDRPAWRDLSVEAMDAVYKRPAAARQIDSPTFCHGMAGLLQVTLRFGNDVKSDVFTTAARTLAGQLLQGFDASNPYGYQAIEPGDIRSDLPGLLDGSAGIAIVLLAAATDVEPTWDRAFLLA